MAVKTDTRNICDTEYTVRSLGARVGAEGLRRIASVSGPVIGSIVSEMKPGGLDANVTVIGNAFLMAVGRLSEADLAWFCDAFSDRTEYGVATQQGTRLKVGLKAGFDDHFAGEYEALVLWLGFCLEVNYSAFFTGMLKRLTSAMATAETGKLGG